MKRTYLRQLLLSPSRPLLIRTEDVASVLMEAFPQSSQIATPSSFFVVDPPTFKQKTQEALILIQQQLKVSTLSSATLTTDFSAEDLPISSIAYHRIWGFITADSRYFFSSKQLELDLLQADANPAISCHFLHINSPGGEAWYLDRLAETIRTLSKPIIALTEQMACSAAYYIASGADCILSITAADIFGSIGTMVETYNLDGYFDKLGIKIIREKADQSDLKNKKYEELRNGKPEQYIKEVLNPLSRRFIEHVRGSRQALAELPEDDPVFRGETFETQAALEKGLIDGTATFLEAVAKAIELAEHYNQMSLLKKTALSFV